MIGECGRMDRKVVLDSSGSFRHIGALRFFYFSPLGLHGVQTALRLHRSRFRLLAIEFFTSLFSTIVYQN